MGIEINETKVEKGQKLTPFKSSVSTQQRVRLDAPKDTVSFTGIGKLIDCDKVMLESLVPKHRKWINAMNSLEWLKGEIGGILITALGTGLVAPIFIGFNPFVRAPKDATPDQKREVTNTKLYTAMRQPISACLAILFQASIQKYIDKGLDKVFNNPDHSWKQRLNTDQSVLNTDTYIKQIAKERLAAEGKKKPSLIKGIFSKNASVERGLYDEAFNKTVKGIQKEQLEGLTDDFIKTQKIAVNNKLSIENFVKCELKRNGVRKPSKIVAFFSKKAKAQRALYDETYENMLEGLKDAKASEIKRVLDNETMAQLINKQIDAYYNDAKNLKKTTDQINYYANKSEILINNEKFFRDLADQLPLKEIENVQFKELITQVLPIDDIKKAKDPKIKETLYKEVDEKIAHLIEVNGDRDPQIKGLLEDLKAHPDQLLEKCEEISKEVSKDKPELFKRLTDTVKDLYEKEADDGVKKELKRILDKPEDLRGNGVSRILQRIDSIKVMCKKRGGYTRRNYIDAMLEKNSVLEARMVDLEDCKIKDLAGADEKVVKETMKKIAKTLHFDRSTQPEVATVLQDTDTFGSNLAELTKKIYGDVAKGFKDLVKQSYKSVNQVTKIAVGALITLPITCTALNWLYPRIMELFFPKLAGVKKAQMQAQAQKDGGDK